MDLLRTFCGLTVVSTMVAVMSLIDLPGMGQGLTPVAENLAKGLEEIIRRKPDTSEFLGQVMGQVAVAVFSLELQQRVDAGNLTPEQMQALLGDDRINLDIDIPDVPPDR